MDFVSWGDITHETRREAHEKIKPKKPGRKQLILKTLESMGEGTAVGVARRLCHQGYIAYPDRNYVHPRLTELSDAGIVETFRKEKDIRTGRMVAVYRIKEEAI